MHNRYDPALDVEDNTYCPRCQALLNDPTRCTAFGRGCGWVSARPTKQEEKVS